MIEVGVRLGPDGLARCAWADSTDDYRAYHDTEWGRPVRGEHALYERITLEAFQSGLSWLTILRKRPAFRTAFAGFDPEVVAGFGMDDVERLLADPGIVRNRAKVLAAITNARAVLALRDATVGGLDALLWSFAPDPATRPVPRRLGDVPARTPTTRPVPRRLGDVPARTPESAALAKALKRCGFVFVGPTTAYAAMQACGLVDDHLAACHARGRA